MVGRARRRRNDSAVKIAIYDNPATMAREAWADGRIMEHITADVVHSVDLARSAFGVGPWSSGKIYGDAAAIEAPKGDAPEGTFFIPNYLDERIKSAAMNIVNQAFDALASELEEYVGVGTSMLVDSRQAVNDRCDELAVRVITELIAEVLDAEREPEGDDE